MAACWAGPHEEGEQVLAPLRALGDPIVDLLGPIPYVALQQLLDPLWTRGASNYFTSAFLDELPDEAVDIYADAHARAAGRPRCASCTSTSSVVPSAGCPGLHRVHRAWRAVRHQLHRPHPRGSTRHPPSRGRGTPERRCRAMAAAPCT